MNNGSVINCGMVVSGRTMVESGSLMMMKAMLVILVLVLDRVVMLVLLNKSDAANRNKPTNVASESGRGVEAR